jgi:serine/threonine protein kinase
MVAIVDDSVYQVEFLTNDQSFASTVYNHLKTSYPSSADTAVHVGAYKDSSSDISSLSKEEVEKVSAQIAQFMYELHNLKYDKSEIFDITANIGLDLNDFIEELLRVHVSEEDYEFWKTDDLIDKSCEDECLVHGDLNSSNIILDKDNNVKAIIDFGFGGFGNKYNDMARIIGRCPEGFKDAIRKSYELLENKEVNREELDREIMVWNKIDSGYINYMRKIGIYGD